MILGSVWASSIEASFSGLIDVVAGNRHTSPHRSLGAEPRAGAVPEPGALDAGTAASTGCCREFCCEFALVEAGGVAGDLSAAAGAGSAGGAGAVSAAIGGGGAACWDWASLAGGGNGVTVA